MIRILILNTIFLITCSTNQKGLKMSTDCISENDCEEILICYKDVMDFKKFYGEVYYEKVYTCMLKEAETSENAQKMLIGFLKYQYDELIKQNRKPCYIAEIWYNPLPMAFSKLRGKEAFELALEYASQTECVDTEDVVGGGNLGLNVIEYIINPMIKSVGGELNLRGYLNVDNYKNRSVKPTSSDPCQRAHEFTYGELIKAYKEGKIVLKKYGEE